MVQEQWLQLKMKFLLGYNMKIVSWEEWTSGGGSWLWGTFLGGRGMSKFLFSGRGTPATPPVEKTLVDKGVIKFFYI